MNYTLREIELSDIETVNSWRSDPELIGHLLAPFRYISPETDKRWYDDYMANRASTVRCAIVAENGKLVGLVSLVRIDCLSRSAELSIMIGRSEDRLQGAGSFAINEMLRHAFENLNLRRVELQVLEDNLCAQHVYEKAGFKLEGLRREAVYKNGKYLNCKLYAVLRRDWAAHAA